MMMRNAPLALSLALGLAAYCACAQGWSAGDSPVIGSGTAVTVSTAQPNIVRFTDNGTLTFAPGGSVTLTGADVTAVGSGIGASGVLTMSGGTITNQGSGYFVVGYLGGTGTMSIASGAVWRSNGGRFRLAGNEEGQRDKPSHGEAAVSGTLIADMVDFTGFFPANLTPPYAECAKLTLNPGGVVEAGLLAKNDCANSTLLFNGGTLRARQDSGDYIVGVGVLAMVIADGANAIFDTNGKNITIKPLPPPYATVLTLRGNGGFVKTGAGSLILRLAASENTFTGAIEVVAGTLDLGRPLAASQTVTVHPGALFVMYSSADAGKVTVLNEPTDRMLYAVGADTAALDLTAISDTFYDDRLGSPLSGAATLSGTLTHNAAAGLVGAPFRLIGQGGMLNLASTTLETKAVLVEGPGTFNFMGSRTLTSADAGKITVTDGGYRQDQVFALADAGPTTPASFALATGRFNVGGSFDVGVNGYGTFAADGSEVSCNSVRIGGGTGYTGAFTQSTGTVTLNSESCVGFDGGTGTLNIEGGQFLVSGTLRVAGNPGDPDVRALRPNAFITVSNALLRCNMFNFTPWWPTDRSSTTNIEAGFLTLLPDSLAEVDYVNKDDDPISTILFDGGLIRGRTSRYGLFTLGSPVGTLRLSATARSNIKIDIGANTVTLHNGIGRLSLAGAGGFEKLGSGALTFSAPQISYAGDTAIDDGALRLGSDNQIPDGPGKGNVKIAANAVLDLNGKSETVNRLIGSGSVLSTNGAATLGVMADGSSDTWQRNWLTGVVLLDKQGTGTLSLATANVIATNATVSAGTLRLTSSDGYPFYRFKIEAVKTPADAVAMQFSELALYNGDVNVVPSRSGILYDTTGGAGGDANVSAYPGGEMPENAVDGNYTGNKWLDFRMKASRSAEDHDRVWLRIDFSGAQKITRYNWATGNDSPDSDPAAWRLQGSNNGTDWIDLDVQSGFAATDTRNVWVSADGFAVSSQNSSPNAIGDQAVVNVKAGATLLLDGVPETLGGLTGLGTLSLSNADLTSSSPASSTNLFGGTVSGNGSLVKTGGGTQGFYGSNTYTGNLTVQNGTLEVYGSTPIRWFRLTIKKNRDNVNVTQFSELSLTSAGGARQNLNLTAGSSVSTLLPGQFASPVAYPTGSPEENTDKLFDNDTGTKWCVNNNTPSVDNPATHYVVVMRLADTTPEITGYNICTANDSLERNPVTWTLEGSADGATWLELDARADVASPTDFFVWYNSGAAYTPAMPAVLGGNSDAIPDTAVVEVRAGATLSVADSSEVIGALRIDMLSAGTITKLTPKPNGALYLVNASGKPTALTIPLTITTVENADALKSWKTYVNGVGLMGYTLTYDPVTGHLRLSAAGTLILLR